MRSFRLPIGGFLYIPRSDKMAAVVVPAAVFDVENQMKSLKAAVRRAKRVPLIGSVVAFAAALYRRRSLGERVARLETRLGVSGQRAESAPTNEDIRNLIVSTPIALRKLRRDVDLLLRHFDLNAPKNPHASSSKETDE